MVYMAQEIVLEGHLRLKSASFSDFKKIDMWAFGMVLFGILNPHQRHPFPKDLADVENPFQSQRELLALKRRPSRSIKYEEFQATDWLRAEKEKQILLYDQVLLKLFHCWVKTASLQKGYP